MEQLKASVLAAIPSKQQEIIERQQVEIERLKEQLLAAYHEAGGYDSPKGFENWVASLGCEEQQLQCDDCGNNTGLFDGAAPGSGLSLCRDACEIGRESAAKPSGSTVLARTAVECYQEVEGLKNDLAIALDERDGMELMLKQAEATLAEWQQAVGLAITIAPTVKIDVADPIGMVQKVCAEVAALEAALAACAAEVKRLERASIRCREWDVSVSRIWQLDGVGPKNLQACINALSDEASQERDRAEQAEAEVRFCHQAHPNAYWRTQYKEEKRARERAETELLTRCEELRVTYSSLGEAEAERDEAVRKYNVLMESFDAKCTELAQRHMQCDHCKELVDAEANRDELIKMVGLLKAENATLIAMLGRAWDDASWDDDGHPKKAHPTTDDWLADLRKRVETDSTGQAV